MVQSILLNKMSQINQLKRIVNIEWTEKLSCEGRRTDTVTITDEDGKKLVIILHNPECCEGCLHALNIALIRIITWMINVQNKGNISIPMGHVSDMVNESRLTFTNV